MSELQKKIDQTYNEVKYSHINWGVHLLPTIKQAVEEFNQEMAAQDLPQVQLNIRSESGKKARTKARAKHELGDQVELAFAPQPLQLAENVPGREALSDLLEEQSRLVFSQSLSGGIRADIYLPRSEISHPVKESYVADSWTNPGLIGKGTVLNLLKTAAELNNYCSAANYPNPKGYQLLSRLEARDLIITQGKSRLWTCLNYFTRDPKAGARFYTSGKK